MINGLAFEDNIPPTISSGRRFRSLDAFVSLFVSELETAYLAIQRAITADDPAADPIMERFDFMSQDECETALKLCEPLVNRPAE